MSELSNKIAVLKGGHSTAEIVQDLGISRETFRRIERGDSVKIGTLREIADYLKATEQDWLELLAAWAKIEFGEDAKKMWIEPRDTGESKLREGAESQTARAMMLFTGLNADDRKQILLAMERPEIRRAIPSLNKLYDALKKDQPTVASAYADIERTAIEDGKNRTKQ